MRKALKFALLILVLAGGFYAWKAEQPIPMSPSSDWQASITSPDFSAETFFVSADGAEIEAMILLPNSATELMGAVVFSGGSGDGLFQNYAPDFLKTYLQDVFLPRGIAVVYANKRGMGASTGNWMNNTIEGRAADLIAVANAVRDMSGIDPQGVGFAGHSQGGWVVVRAAVEDPQTAFVLNFMGPLRSTKDQFDYMWHEVYTCEGKSPEEVERAFARKDWVTRVAMRIGRFFPIGMLEFDSKFFLYETDGLLAQVSAPLLSIYGGNDILVSGPENEAYLGGQFPDGVPQNLEAITIEGLNHTGNPTPNVCAGIWGQGPHDRSPALVSTIDTWLSRIGY
jgi:pimeloyl-ACP methyl ester carboxylesterase